MHGVIVVDKPPGPTSAEVVREIKKRIGRAAKVGHLGTLDPFATGVLPILIGEGTKLAPFIQEGEKEYNGLIALGTETDTLDPTGKVVREAAVPVLEEGQLAEIGRRFVGEIQQTPPIYSAIKRGGVRSYKMARQNVEWAEHAPRQVMIHRLDLKAESAARIRFVVVCGPGMYVRALARDIGVALGSAAHLRELRRERNGIFTLAHAMPLQAMLERLDTGEAPPLTTLREALPQLAEVEIDAVCEQRLRNGDASALQHLIPGEVGVFKVISKGRLVAIARTTSRVSAAIIRIFNEP